MRMLYVYQGDWPRNATRPRKQTQALVEAGHRVRLLCANPRGEPRLTEEPWMEVERLPRLRPARINRMLMFPIFVNPFWLWSIHRSAKRFRADGIIVRDLPLAPAALAVSRLLGVSLHYEMADVYPIAFRANRDAHPGLASRLVRRPEVAEWLDRIVVRRATSVFVVSEESRQRCIAIGAAPEAVVVVGNTPDELPPLGAKAAAPEDISDWVGRPLVVFLGNLLSDRGLDDAIRAMVLVRDEISDAALIIIGDGPEHDRLLRLIRGKGLEAHVRMLGWKRYTEHAAYYRFATVGILPFRATPHIEITIANKLFDYMASSLAIVASDVPPMRRVIEETQAGVLVRPGSPSMLAEKLIELLRDPERSRHFGRNGRAAVEGVYNWSADKARLLMAVARSEGRP